MRGPICKNTGNGPARAGGLGGCTGARSRERACKRVCDTKMCFGARGRYREALSESRVDRIPPRRRARKRDGQLVRFTLTKYVFQRPHEEVGVEGLLDKKRHVDEILHSR